MDSNLNSNSDLAKTYWIFGVIGSVIARFITDFMLVSGVNSIIVLVIKFTYLVIIWMAIWASATKYKGFKLWAILAKVSVVFGILGSLAQFNQ